MSDFALVQHNLQGSSTEPRTADFVLWTLRNLISELNAQEQRVMQDDMKSLEECVLRFRDFFLTISCTEHLERYAINKRQQQLVSACIKKQIENSYVPIQQFHRAEALVREYSRIFVCIRDKVTVLDLNDEVGAFVLRKKSGDWVLSLHGLCHQLWDRFGLSLHAAMRLLGSWVTACGDQVALIPNSNGEVEYLDWFVWDPQQMFLEPHADAKRPKGDFLSFTTSTLSSWLTHKDVLPQRPEKECIFHRKANPCWFKRFRSWTQLDRPSVFKSVPMCKEILLQCDLKPAETNFSVILPIGGLRTFQEIVAQRSDFPLVVLVDPEWRKQIHFPLWTFEDERAANSNRITREMIKSVWGELSFAAPLTRMESRNLKNRCHKLRSKRKHSSKESACKRQKGDPV